MSLSGSSVAARIVLLGSVFLIAACGLVYELVAGAVSSYILGDAVTQFSLVIGVFLSSMGLGSYLAKYIRGNLLKFHQQRLDKVVEVIHLLQFASAILIQLAVPGENVQLFEQLY